MTDPKSENASMLQSAAIAWNNDAAQWLSAHLPAYVGQFNADARMAYDVIGIRGATARVYKYVHARVENLIEIQKQV